MEMPEYEAYNLTRGCYLGTEIVAGEFVQITRRQWLPKLTSGSGIGLWMKPFRGIHPDEVPNLVDLIYLDEDCHIIDAVEGFPASRVTSASHNVVSVLALPSDSIKSSQTKTGDQLLLSLPGKMEGLLKQLAQSGVDSGASSKEGFSGNENPVHVGEGLLITDRPDPMQAKGEPAGPEPVGKKRNWLQRWLSPDPTDPRGASREDASGFTACFWTGGKPEVHEIREISANGMYVVTDERWYPGTIIQITIARPDNQEPHGQRTLTVTSKAVRSGNDGVGFEFVLRDGLDKKVAKTLPSSPVDRNALSRFLK